MHTVAAPPEPVPTPGPSSNVVRRYANPLVVAVALIVVQLAVRGWVAGRGYFYWDDLILAGRAGRYPLLSTDLLLYNHDGHFMPAAFALAWVITRLAPYAWAGPVISMLILQLAASAAVLRMLLVLEVPAYGSQLVARDGNGCADWRSRCGALAGGVRWTILLPLVFYLFCPLTLPAFAWWSAALNALPLQFALAWMVGDALLLVRTGRRRYAASGCGVLLVALLFFEKSVIVPFVAFAAAALVRYVDGRDRPIRVVLRRGAGLWIGSTGVLLCWLAAYLTVVHNISVVRSSWAGVRALLHHAISRGIVPALLGGPWEWERWLPSTPWAAPPGWAVVGAWIVVCLIAAQSIRARRRVWPVWIAVAVYVVAAQLPVALIRGGPNTTAELSQSLRYLADLAVPLAVAGALLLRADPRRPGCADRAWPRALRGDASLPPPGLTRPGRSVVAPVAVTALVVAFLASSLWSTWSFSRSWSISPTRIYLTNVKSALAAGGAPLLEQDMPWNVLSPLIYPQNRIGAALAPLVAPGMVAHSTGHLRMITDAGRIVDATVWWNRGILPGPDPGCGYRITGAVPAPVPLNGPMLDNAWTAQLNYLADRDGHITVGLEHGETVLAPVRAGLHTVYVRIIGGGSLLRIGSPTPGLNLCLGVGPVGVASYER